MSQAGIISTGSAGVGPVDTLTGNTGGAVPPDGSNNINVIGSGDISVTGDPGTSTLTVSLKGYNHGSTTTVGAVSSNVITVALGAVAGTYTFDVKVAAFNAATPAGAGFTIVGSVRTTGAAAVLVPGQAVDEFTEVALDDAEAALAVSGNNALITVTGVAGLTIDWVADSQYTFAS